MGPIFIFSICNQYFPINVFFFFKFYLFFYSYFYFLDFFTETVLYDLGLVAVLCVYLGSLVGCIMVVTSYLSGSVGSWM